MGNSPDVCSSVGKKEPPVSRHLPSTKPAVPLVSRDFDATLLIVGNPGCRTCVSSHAWGKGRGWGG